jgi:hypothetical protein
LRSGSKPLPLMAAVVSVPSETFPIEVLLASVRARFTAEGTNAEIAFGWREPEKHALGPNRIIWVPGDPSGALGTTTGARQLGRNPRPLATLNELFTVWIASADTTAPDNELAQYKAVRVLRDLWYRAVYKAAHGTFAIRSESWLTNIKERRYGAALRIVFELQAMVPDVAQELAPVDLGADIALQLNDEPDPPDVTVP